MKLPSLFFPFGLIALFTSYLLASQAQGSGFSKGNSFTVFPISGRVLVQCVSQSGGVYTQYHNCYAELFSPSQFDYFVGTKGIDADTVELKAYHEGGTVEAKSSDYDSNLGRSSKKFNLWVSTLFQTPLLEIGKNRVEFKLTKETKPIDQGEFYAQVSVAKNSVCRQGTLFDNSESLCQNPNSACQRYFERENYCQ